MSKGRTQAISAIQKHGILLVFPIKNRSEALSLWSQFYPRSQMKWEWDDNGDRRVANLWYLMKELSECREVIYSKWYQGRATFFSRDVFTAMLCALNAHNNSVSRLPRTSQELLEILETNSPLSTKILKKAAELQGKDNEPEYTRAMKSLFARLFVVAFGEVDDGAFPSLAVGATSLLFEELCEASKAMPIEEARALLDRQMPLASPFRKYFERVANALKNE